MNPDRSTLAQGRLVEARIPPAARTSGATSGEEGNSTAYYLIYPDARKPNPALDVFREWLLAESGADRTRGLGTRRLGAP